jgi:hypothetical protein
MPAAAALSPFNLSPQEASMAQTRKFDGKVVMYSTLASFPGPKEVPLKFQATFDGAAWSVTPDQFGKVVIDDIAAPGHGTVTLTVTLHQLSEGSWDNASRLLTLKARFDFTVVHIKSTLRLAFDCVTEHSLPAGSKVKGHSVDGAGAFAMASKGTFQGGLLDGETCLVLLDGALTPAPT